MTQNPTDAQSKPSIHVSKKDARITHRLSKEDESPSTLYSEALEKLEKVKLLEKKQRYEKTHRINELLKEHESRFGEEAREELEKVFL